MEPLIPSLNGPWIPCLNDLGSSYDVIRGVYADSGSCKIRLVDWDKGQFRDQEVTDSLTGQTKTFQIPTSVSFHSTNKSSFYSVSGSSKEKYSKDLTSHTGLEGDYSFFSGSLSVDYATEDTSSLASNFTKIQHFISLYNLILPPLSTFKKLLKDEVALHINDDARTPDELYIQYGTHFLNSVAVGGRAAFTSATDTRNYSSSTSIEVAAKMSYKAVVGSITAEEKVKYKQAMESFHSSSSKRVQTTGGNPSFANDDFPKHVKDWADSVLAYPAMEDFGPLPAFFPIWELASSPGRRKALQDALPIYLAQHNKDLDIPPPYLKMSSTKFSLRLAGWVIVTWPIIAISFSRPQTDDQRYFLGPLFNSNQSDILDGPVMLPCIPSAMADVKRWEVIGIFAKHDKFNVAYRGFGPTPDYILLCDLIVEQYPITMPPLGIYPPAHLVENLKTVHISCLKLGTYTNRRSITSDPEISIWEISEGGVSSGFWKIAKGDSMPSSPAYVLNPEYITPA